MKTLLLNLIGLIVIILPKLGFGVVSVLPFFATPLLLAIYLVLLFVFSINWDKYKQLIMPTLLSFSLALLSLLAMNDLMDRKFWFTNTPFDYFSNIVPLGLCIISILVITNGYYFWRCRNKPL